MNKIYIPLHGHSHYSVGDSPAKITDIINRAKEINAPAISITEHGNLNSFIEFYEKSKENNIKPIIGIEFYINNLFFENKKLFLDLMKEKRKKDDNEFESDYSEDYIKSKIKNSHFLVYSKNLNGLKNLFYLNNKSYENENYYYKPLLHINDVYNKLDNNNIITTGCLNSFFNVLLITKENELFTKYIKIFIEKFSNDFYFEIQLNNLDIQHYINNFYINLIKNKKFNNNIILSLDFHYAKKEDWIYQYYLYLFRDKKTINQMPPEKWFYQVRDLYIKSYDDIINIAKKYNYDIKIIEKALENTIELGEKIEDYKLENEYYIPRYPKYIDNNKKENNIEIFLNNVINGLKEKINNNQIDKNQIEEYKNRLQYECEVIIKNNYQDYFLILKDIIDNFIYKNNGNIGTGRGSAAGSLVSWLLGITKIDPIRNKLIFERFINPGRLSNDKNKVIDPPDIDLDTSSDIHKKIEKYLIYKYGSNNVCHVVNYIKYSPKLIIKDFLRINEVSYDIANNITKIIPDELSSDKVINYLLNNLKNKNALNIIEKYKNELEQILNALDGVIRQLGKHASGIVISNTDLKESLIPLSRVKGELVSGLREGGEYRDVSKLGYLKLDILGLNNVLIYSKTIKKIEKKYNISYNLEEKIIETIYTPEKYIEVYKNYWNENTDDIFQFGSKGMKKLLKTIKPKNIEDLSAINALYRPGVISAGGIYEYIKNKESDKNDIINKLNEKYGNKFWELVKETYGIPIYQEQIMFIFKEIGGFTLAEADKIRKVLKVIDKKLKAGVKNFPELKEFNDILIKFKENAIKNKYANNIQAENIVNLLREYAEYSFNKSHSLCYAVNSYITMFLKTFYKKEYYEVLLNYSTFDELNAFLKIILNDNFKLNKFVLENATPYFTINDNIVNYGLYFVKGINSQDISKIIDMKNNVKNIEDLIYNIFDKKITKKTIEPLILVGFFENICSNTKYLYEIYLNANKNKNKVLNKKYKIEINESDIQDFSIKEKIQFEIKYLNFVINNNLFNQLKDYILNNAVPIYMPSMIKNIDYINNINIIGYVKNIYSKISSKGNKYYIITLSDWLNDIYINSWSKNKIKEIKEGQLILAEITKNNYGFVLNKYNQIEQIGE